MKFLLVLCLTGCAGYKNQAAPSSVPAGQTLNYQVFAAEYCQHLSRFFTCEQLYSQYMASGK